MMEIVGIVFIFVFFAGLIFSFFLSKWAKKKDAKLLLNRYSYISENKYINHHNYNKLCNFFEKKLLGWAWEGIELILRLPTVFFAILVSTCIIVIFIALVFPLLGLLLVVAAALFLMEAWPLLSLRSELINSARKNQPSPLPLLRLSTNFPGRWSTFAQPFLFKREREPRQLSYVLLNDIEAETIINFSGYWLHENLSRHVFLLDPENDHCSGQEMNRYLDLAKEHASHPHISLLGLFLKKPAQGTDWKKIWDFLDAAGDVKVVQKEQLTAQPALAAILTELPAPALNTQKIVKEMGAEFLYLHNSITQGPTPIAEMYRKVCQVDSMPQAVFLLFDLLDAMHRLTAFTLLSLNGKSVSSLRYMEEPIVGTRNLAQLIRQQIEENPPPEPWSRHFNRINTGVPQDLLSYDLEALQKFLYPIRIEAGENLKFQGLANLITVLRNKTRGHGVITEDLAKVVAPPLFRLTVIMAYLMRINEIESEILGSEYKLKSAASEPVLLSPFIWASPENNNLFFFLNFHKHKKISRMTYVDYISGDYIRPEIKEVLRESPPAHPTPDDSLNYPEKD